MERRRLLDKELVKDAVFYAPLIQGDTTDHVSGNSVTIDSRASLSWSSSENAYLFTTPSTGYVRYDGFVWQNLNLGIFRSPYNSIEFTLNFYVKINTIYYTGGKRAYYRGFPQMAHVTSNGYAYGCMLEWDDWVNYPYDITNLWYQYTVTCSNNVITTYIDGITADTKSLSINLSGYTINDCNKRVVIFPIYHTSSSYPHSGSSYIREVSIFNRVLTLNEIQSL